MNIQIIGSMKCKDTQKMLRFFKEHNIKVHFKDLKNSPIALGELESILRNLKQEDLLNKDAKLYKTKLAYCDFDFIEEVLADETLLKTPILRWDKKAYLGFDEAILKELMQTIK